MLDELCIEGLGVIDAARLPLGPGLTVVTGETGAGKTMVVTGLQLLFGGRADPARVRSGAARACVDGHVEVAADSRVAQRIRDAGGELDDGTGLVLRRVVSAAGRSRGYAGGAPVPAAVLAELGEHLLAVHGQSDQIRLARPAQQRAALDRHARIDTSAYAAAYERWRDAERALAERTGRLGELSREADLLRHGIDEIEAAQPQPGEGDELAGQINRLAHADALRLAARTGHDALRGDPDDPAGEAADVVTVLGTAARALGAARGADAQLDELAGRFDELAVQATELGADFASYAERIDADPRRLEQLEARRAVLTALVRKYGDRGGVDAVLAWADTSRARLAEIDVSDEALAALAARRDEAARDAARAAGELSAARTAAARELADAVTAELSGLAMPGARLVIDVRPRASGGGASTLSVDGAELALTSDGADEIEFCLRPHPDSPALPLGRGASGGELSRVMLAVEVCLAGTDPVATLVFDEVDAGVGGRAATEVGLRLARLARGHQVIVVTHLAQVAAFADRHIVVGKPHHGEGGGAVVASDVTEVTGDGRLAELARMLAGTGSATAREHAAELLDDALARRKAPRPGRARRGTTGRTRGAGAASKGTKTRR